MMKRSLLFFLLGPALSLSAQPLLRLHGSTTVKAALEARLPEIEARAEVRLELRALGSASGLQALTAGAADVAMISTPLEEVAHRLNEKKPGSVAVGEFQSAEIGTMRLAFIVNPRNTVRRLSAAQLAGIFTGRVDNWRQLDGPSLPIVVVTLANAGPLVEEKLLGGAKITERARAVANTTQIPPIVAEDLAAIGIVSAAHARGQTSLVATDAEIVTPLFLVTRGEPSPQVRRLIETVRAVLAEKGS